MLTGHRQQWQDRLKRSRKKVFILPTRYGYFYAVLILIMLLGAINYNNSLGHLLCFLMMGLGQVTMHYNYRNVRQLDYAYAPVEPVFCHQPIQLPIKLINAGSRPRQQLQFSYPVSGFRPSWWPFSKFSAYQTIYQTAILPSHELQWHYLPIPTSQRGWMKLNRIRVSSNYPLGLLISWFYIDNDQRVLVYPQPFGDKPLPISSSDEDGLAKPQPGLDEFAGYRRYQEGDPRQHIAWKALARDGVLRSKYFSSPAGENVMLRWEHVSDLPDTEARLSQLCKWIVNAEAQGLRYGVELPNQMIALNSGRQHQHLCLKSLALHVAS